MSIFASIGAGIAKGIFGDIFGIARDWFKSKRQMKEAELRTKLAIESAKAAHVMGMAEQQKTGDLAWEKIMAEGSKSSWKDEFFVIVLSIPFVGAMFGHGEFASRAFEAMKNAPEWYQAAFMVAVGASFGVRIWERYTTVKKRNGNG